MHVKTLCLGALALGDATGYEIKKMFEDGVLSHFLEASFGSIYPALTRLTEEGLVTCHAEAQERRPDKKIYSITEAGRDALAAACQEPIAKDKFRSEFLFVMIFAHLLPPRLIGALLDQEIARYEDEIDRLVNDPEPIETPSAEFIRGFGIASLKAGLKYLKDNRRKLENSLESKLADPVP